RHDVTEPILLEVDQIYNLACPASPVHYQYNPVKTVKTSVMGAINMLGMAKRVRARILQASTSEVYGDPLVHPQTEDYFGNVNSIGLRSCFSDDTEILTKNGWEKFPDVTREDEVATLTKTHSIEYHRPLEVIKQRYVGELINFQNHNSDLLVTPNHKMYVREREGENFELIPAFASINWSRAQMLKVVNYEAEDKEWFSFPFVEEARRFAKLQFVDSYKLISDFQEILLKIGFAGNIGLSDTRKEKPIYSTHILNRVNKRFVTPTYSERTVEFYDGYVYCVNVPNHVIYVRRNGKALFCGNCYDEGKRVAETLFMDYHRQNGVDTRIVRIFNTFGPKMLENDGRVVSNFIVQALRGDDLTIYGSGEQTRSFCYVDDLVEGLIRLMNTEKETINLPVNIGNPGEFTMNELAREVARAVGKDVKIKHLPLPPDDPKQRQPNIERAKNLLGWSPTIPLAEGLQKTVDYFAKRIEKSEIEG
ncbi:MAG: GDP-mannose 4,6-dehydratase, partial [Acidobacteria bacterium]|nr:GDP-mannose 4,6-dehydratase [Acidobacteriota bacterium]